MMAEQIVIRLATINSLMKVFDIFQFIFPFWDVVIFHYALNIIEDIISFHLQM